MRFKFLFKKDSISFMSEGLTIHLEVSPGLQNQLM